MPTSGGYHYGFWEADPRRWERCRQQAAAQMVAEGWNPHAGKFSQVQMRRARKLWARG
jgi:hypothetical protein